MLLKMFKDATVEHKFELDTHRPGHMFEHNI